MREIKTQRKRIARAILQEDSDVARVEDILVVEASVPQAEMEANVAATENVVDAMVLEQDGSLMPLMASE